MHILPRRRLGRIALLGAWLGAAGVASAVDWPLPTVGPCGNTSARVDAGTLHPAAPAAVFAQDFAALKAKFPAAEYVPGFTAASFGTKVAVSVTDAAPDGERQKVGWINGVITKSDSDVLLNPAFAGVKPEYQRNGIYRLLLAAALKEHPEVTVIEGGWTDDNAKAFFTELGSGDEAAGKKLSFELQTPESRESPQGRALILRALLKTPAYRIRAALGFGQVDLATVRILPSGIDVNVRRGPPSLR